VRLHVGTTSPSGAWIQSIFLELAREDSVGRHLPEEDPDRADAILFVDPQSNPDDLLLAGLREHPEYRCHMEKAFIYHYGDNPLYTLPGIYVGATPRWPRRLPVVGGPYPNTVTEVPTAIEDPDLLFSYRGAASHSVRAKLIKLRHERAVLEESDASPWGGQTNATDLTFAQVRHIRLIHRSKFVLCPRGAGPSSFRMFEALAAGRVPVVISDEWLPPPGVDWGGCSVRIRERDAFRTLEILTALEPQWPGMVERVHAARERFKRERLWDHFAQSLQIVAALPRPHRVPAWMRAKILRVQLGERRQALKATIAKA